MWPSGSVQCHSFTYLSVYFELGWKQNVLLSKVQVWWNYSFFSKHIYFKAQPEKLNKVPQGLRTTSVKAGGCRTDNFSRKAPTVAIQSSCLSSCGTEQQCQRSTAGSEQVTAQTELSSSAQRAGDVWAQGGPVLCLCPSGLTWGAPNCVLCFAGTLWRCCDALLGSDRGILLCGSTSDSEQSLWSEHYRQLVTAWTPCLREGEA